MPYDISSRLDSAGERFKELNDNSIVYRSGATKITINNVTLAGVNVEQLAIHGLVQLTDVAQDFIFDTAEISTIGDPETHHEIIFNGNVFSVMSIGDEVFTYITSTQKRIRVHAKKIGEQ